MSKTDEGEATSEMSCTKEKAHKLCKDYLGGAWKDISCSEMIFRTISGGLSNTLYFCSLPENVKFEPHQVVLRQYGVSYNEDSSFVVTECVMFTILSERGLAPRLYGIFPGGRFEEYIPSPPLTAEQLRDPVISVAIACKMAKLHTLRVPLNKEPSWIFDSIKLWMDRVHVAAPMASLSAENKALADKIFSYDLEKEVNWLRSFLKKLGSPVVFSHNDLQKGNILLPDGPEDLEERLIFIDYEFSSYNYRGYDIAQYFEEQGIDCNLPVHPYFTILKESLPTEDEKLRFVRAYLSVLGECNEEKETRLLEEIDGCILAGHLIGTIWAICSAYTSKIKFGYFPYIRGTWQYLKETSVFAGRVNAGIC